MGVNKSHFFKKAFTGEKPFGDCCGCATQIALHRLRYTSAQDVPPAKAGSFVGDPVGLLPTTTDSLALSVLKLVRSNRGAVGGIRAVCRAAREGLTRARSYRGEHVPTRRLR